METRTMPLPDGRTLAWCEYGDPEGAPLFFFHGLPGSRLFRLPDWSRPGGTRLRIIATDRPGVGRSTFQPGRRLLDWPADVHRLAGRLGLERYLVAGISGGGPHALACAARLPQEVAACGLLSSAGPLDDPEVWNGMHSGNRMIFGLARHAPLVLRGYMWLNRVLSAGQTHEAMLRASAKMLPPADVEALQDPEFYAILVEATREATRPGVRGVVQEAVMATRPWGYALSEVTVPAFLWQGGADRNVPEVAGRHLAEQIRGCRAVFEPAAGHMLTITRWDEVEAALLSAW